jgi:hypothetical protein
VTLVHENRVIGWRRVHWGASILRKRQGTCVGIVRNGLVRNTGGSPGYLDLYQSSGTLSNHNNQVGGLHIVGQTQPTPLNDRLLRLACY